MAHFAVTAFGNVIIVNNLIHNLSPLMILHTTMLLYNFIISDKKLKVKPIAVLN